MHYRIVLIHEKYGRQEARLLYKKYFLWWLAEPVARGTKKQIERTALYWKIEYCVPDSEIRDLRENETVV